MSKDFKFTKELIELRRARVLDLLAKGKLQVDIAHVLGVSPALVCLDIQYIKSRAQEAMNTHIQETLPYEYVRAMIGMNNALSKVSEILDNASDTKTKLDCLRLQTELYRSMLNTSTEAGIVERAMKTIKIISPFPGEEIPTVTEEELVTDDNEDEGEKTEPEEDIEKE